MATYVNTRKYDVRTRTVVILDEEVVEERAEMAGAELEKVKEKIGGCDSRKKNKDLKEGASVIFFFFPTAFFLASTQISSACSGPSATVRIVFIPGSLSKILFEILREWWLVEGRSPRTSQGGRLRGVEAGLANVRKW